MQEIELKFQIPAARLRAVSSFFQGRAAQAIRLEARYFDTLDHGLARQGIALRLRSENGHWVQTLKAAGPHGVARWEHNAPIDNHDGAALAPDIDRHRGSPAHEALAACLARLRGQGQSTALTEMYQTAVDRRIRCIEVDGSVVELAFDVGAVAAGAARMPLCELEFELKSGAVPALFAAALSWVDRHGLCLDTVSKSERGHLLATGRAQAAPVAAQAPSVASAMDTPAFARAVVSACLRQVLPNACAVATGNAGAEHIHLLRVGLKRLRVALRELAEFSTGLDPSWQAPLEAVFRGLGRQRDQMLVEETLRSELPAQAPRVHWPSPASPPSTMVALAQAPDFQSVLLQALAFAIDAVPGAGAGFDGAPLEAVSDRLDMLLRRQRRDAKRFERLAPERQHQVRKRLKRLRYLAEFIAPLFRARKGVEKYIGALKIRRHGLPSAGSAPGSRH
jgi:triphosphatase